MSPHILLHIIFLTKILHDTLFLKLTSFPFAAFILFDAHRLYLIHLLIHFQSPGGATWLRNLPHSVYEDYPIPFTLYRLHPSEYSN